MSGMRIFGVVLFVIGVVLITIGVIDSRSLADNLSTFFRGRPTQDTMWYFVGGIASAAVGLLLASGVGLRRRS